MLINELLSVGLEFPNIGIIELDPALWVPDMDSLIVRLKEPRPT